MRAQRVCIRTSTSHCVMALNLGYHSGMHQVSLGTATSDRSSRCLTTTRVISAASYTTKRDTLIMYSVRNSNAVTLAAR